MKIAVISDIHGNASAFREVLSNIQKASVDEIFCLGDNIGYGPEPEEVMTMLLAHHIPSVIGNHELAVKNPNFLSWFNPAARISLQKTMALLSTATHRYIESLPDYMSVHGCRLVHGFPPDSPTLYLFEITEEGMKTAMQEMTEQVCFVGHTHELVMISYDGQEIARRPLKRETIKLDPDKKYIINVGSVGQPRDGNNYAKYAIWDTDAKELAINYVPYNINETVSKIYEAGLPEQHAWRLL